MDQPPQDPTDHPEASVPPQRRALRIVLGAVIVAVVVYVLFTVVFPWIEEYQDDPTLEGAWEHAAALALR